ncbi:MAG TPA: exodeoxyribonuclease VII large subunit [Phycisphaerales bacterium]|nr:exodeoxyribonuclease VII large subunit [Phycisphaerales bacterium]
MATPRLPFDPSKMAAAKTQGPAATPPPSTTAAAPQTLADQPITITQLAARIDTALKQGVPDTLRVIGEVSGFRERTHWYFDLKDEQAAIACAVFANAARKVPFTPENGQQVIARGRIDFYAKAGKVTFIVERLEPVGAGALDLAYKKLVEEVRALGWFDHDRKRPLPIFPRRVAVITSRSAAALQDVLDTMRRRCPAVGVLLVDVRVQGDVAPEIVRAIRRVSRDAHALSVDAVLITRGGGSAEDLFVFNDKEVARAIVECSIPVVAAIGHETDTTIAELVADLRAATPTQAAMRLTPDRDALERQLSATASRMDLLLRRRVDAGRQHVLALARSPLLASPLSYIAAHHSHVDAAGKDARHALLHTISRAKHQLADAAASIERARPSAVLARMTERLTATEAQLTRAAKVFTTERAQTLSSVERQLHAVSPLRVMERGFSVTTQTDGSILRDASSAKPGETLHTRLTHGTVTSTVTGSLAQTPTRKPARKPGDHPHQQGLFPS